MIYVKFIYFKYSLIIKKFESFCVNICKTYNACRTLKTLNQILKYGWGVMF